MRMWKMDELWFPERKTDPAVCLIDWITASLLVHGTYPNRSHSHKGFHESLDFEHVQTVW